MQEVLTNLAPSLIIAVVASWVTVQFSLRKFRTQKLWEKKFEAYSNLLDALSDAIVASVTLEDHLTNPNPLSDQELKEAVRLNRSSRATIFYHHGIGEFLLQKQTIDRISKHRIQQAELRKDLDNGRDFYEVVVDQHADFKKCREDMISLAKQDLKI